MASQTTQLAVAVLVLSLGSPSPGVAEDDASAQAPVPAVALDQLLRLPTGYDTVKAQRGGATASEWRARYERAVGDMSDAQLALERAKAELGETASDTSQWQVAAPGGSASSENGPLSFRLRQEIRRQKDLFADAKRRFRDLEVSADLAGVPSQWRLKSPESPPPGPGDPAE